MRLLFSFKLYCRYANSNKQNRHNLWTTFDFRLNDIKWKEKDWLFKKFDTSPFLCYYGVFHMRVFFSNYFSYWICASSWKLAIWSSWIGYFYSSFFGLYSFVSFGSWNSLAGVSPKNWTNYFRDRSNYRGCIVSNNVGK